MSSPKKGSTPFPLCAGISIGGLVAVLVAGGVSWALGVMVVMAVMLWVGVRYLG